MATLTAFQPTDLSQLKFPTASDMDFVIYTNANSLSFGDKSANWFSFFGPFSSGNSGDSVTRITLFSPTDAVLLKIEDLDIWEYELLITFRDGDKAALADIFSYEDSMTFSAGNDVGNGFDGNDTLRGNGGNDHLSGGLGSDRLLGGNGADTLLGGLGRDFLAGADGKDVLTGGKGADKFVFTTVPVPVMAQADQITDFKAEDDAILLKNTVFTAFSYTGQIHSENFVAGSAARDGDDFVIYKKATGSLWYDADGKGAGAQVLIADLVDGTTLTASDIFLI